MDYVMMLVTNANTTKHTNKAKAYVNRMFCARGKTIRSSASTAKASVTHMTITKQPADYKNNANGL